jgi:hypothetical protein
MLIALRTGRAGLEHPVNAAGRGIQRINLACVAAHEDAPSSDRGLRKCANSPGKTEAHFNFNRGHLFRAQARHGRRLHAMIGRVHTPAVPISSHRKTAGRRAPPNPRKSPCAGPPLPPPNGLPVTNIETARASAVVSAFPCSAIFPLVNAANTRSGVINFMAMGCGARATPHRDTARNAWRRWRRHPGQAPPRRRLRKTQKFGMHP